MGELLPLTLACVGPRFQVPGDGYPSIDDWVQTFESMIFGGIDLGREPIDGSLATNGKPGLQVKKNINVLNFNLRYGS